MTEDIGNLCFLKGWYIDFLFLNKKKKSYVNVYSSSLLLHTPMLFSTINRILIFTRIITYDLSYAGVTVYENKYSFHCWNITVYEKLTAFVNKNVLSL